MMLASATAKQWLDNDCLFFDIKVTDEDLREHAEVIALTIISANGNTLFDRLIRPRSVISAGTSIINDIGRKELENASSLPELLPEINRIISGKTLVGYNANYLFRCLERDTINAGYEIVDLATKACTIGCAMETFSQFYGLRQTYGYMRHRLEFAARFCKVNAAVETSSHICLGRCHMLMGLVQYMAQHHDQIRISSNSKTADLVISRHGGKPDTIRLFYPNTQMELQLSMPYTLLLELGDEYKMSFTGENNDYSLQLPLPCAIGEDLHRIFPELHFIAKANGGAQ